MLACLGQYACSPDGQKLTGQWQAVAFYENGKSVLVPLDSVVLKLDEQAGYLFRSLGQYSESGNYQLTGSYLFLSDTTVRPVQQHTLKILYLSTDSLKLEMSKAGKAQVLFFARLPK